MLLLGVTNFDQQKLSNENDNKQDNFSEILRKKIGVHEEATDIT